MFPTAADVVADAEYRAGLIARLAGPNASLETLEEDEWKGLIWYQALHPEQLEAFKVALLAAQQEGPEAIDPNDHPPHARWLLSVYTGRELTAGSCKGGSRFHARVIEAQGGSYRPKKILRQLAGLTNGLNELKARPPSMDPAVIDNIAIDEPFEQVGRAMR